MFSKKIKTNHLCDGFYEIFLWHLQYVDFIIQNTLWLNKLMVYLNVKKNFVKNLFLNHIKIINLGLLHTRSCSDNIVNLKNIYIYSWTLSFIKDL